MSEEWRTVVGSEGFYEVSDLGRVRSVDRWFVRSDGRRQFRRGRVLVPCMVGKPRRYLSVALRFGKRRSVHLLVCEAFHGPRPSVDHEAAHGNGNSIDNRASNLRWATRSENQQDSVRHGTKRCWSSEDISGESSYNAKLTEDDVALIRSLYASGDYSQRKLATMFPVGKSQIANIVSGKRWKQAA